MPRDLLAPAAGPRDLLEGADTRRLIGADQYGNKVYQPNELPGMGPDPNAHLQSRPGNRPWDDPSNQNNPMVSTEPGSLSYSPEQAAEMDAASAESARRAENLRGKRPRVPSAGRSFVRGLEQGASLRFSDEAIPAITTGFGIWGDYGKEVLRHRARYEEAMQAHPVAYATGEIAGSLPLVAVPGGNALRAATMGARVKASAAVGAGQGALMDAGGAEGNPLERFDEAAIGALKGAGVGAIAAPATAYVGNTVKTGYGMIAGNSGRPGRLLDEYGVDRSRIASETGRNPRLSPADIDTNAQQMLQGAVTATPGARKVVAENVGRQSAEMPSMIRGAMDNAAGQAPDPSETLTRLMNEAKSNADAGFRPVLQAAGPIDTSRVVSSIDLIAARSRVEGGGAFTPRGPGGELLPADDYLLRFREKLNGVTDPERLHRIQTEMRETADRLASSTVAGEKEAAVALRRLRQELIDDIDAPTGGKYRAAQRQFADDLAVRDAFNKGMDIFRNRSGSAGVDDTPGAWRTEIEGMSEAERNGLREGARAAMEQAMGTVRNASRAGTEVPQIDFNRQKLEAVLGADETAQMVAVLQDAQSVAQKTNRVLGNSETASRGTNAERMAERPGARLSGDTLLPIMGLASDGTRGAWLGLALAGANKLRQRAQQTGSRAENMRLAQALSQTGPGAVSELNSLAVAPRSPAEIERLIRALLVTGGNTQAAPAVQSVVERAFPR